MYQELRCRERYFREAFVRDVGISPKRWLKENRMIVAKGRLDEGVSPDELAEELGFTSCRAFRRAFVAWFRVLPREWAGRSRNE